MSSIKNISGAWWFFIATSIVYFILGILKYNLFMKSLSFFVSLLIKIIPIFILIWVLMALVDRYVSTRFIIKHLPRGSFRRWIFTIIAGVISVGSIYMWYPLLSDLHKKGFDYGLIACFLYNRAIKVPLLPVAIYYFGLKYVIILTVVMVLVSIGQGLIINRLVEDKI